MSHHRWYLVGHGHNKVRTYRTSRIHALTVTEAPFTRPADFDLGSHWQHARDEYAQGFPTYPIRLRLRGEALIGAGWAPSRSRSFGAADHDGWVDAEIDTEDWDSAIALVGSLGGSDLVVLGPDRLRQRVIANATRLLELSQT